MSGIDLREVVVFLAAAGLVIPLVQRLRISPVLGFLVIGLVIGPFALGRLTDGLPWLDYVVITDVDSVRSLTEPAVVFLLFMIGLELSFERLWAMRRLVFGLGGAQVLVSALLIGGVARAFGNSVAASVVLGACLALSSTAIVMQLLTEQHRFGSATGRSSFAILLAQDLAVVPILFIVGAFAAEAGESVVLAFGMALGEALLAIALILGVGRLVIRPLFRFVGALNSAETFMAATLLVILVTALATEHMGLSAGLGAFLVGLLFAETEFRHEIEVNIEPYRGLLLGVFFMSVGMGIDLAEVASNPVWIALSVVGLVALKAVVIVALARVARVPRSAAVETALLLGPGGEFAFVVIGLAAAEAVLPQATAQFMLIVVGATMFITPLIARGARALATRLEAGEGPAAATPGAGLTLEGHVVIAGYGRTGRLIAEMLDQQRIPHVALDLSASRVAELRALDAPVYFGDASRAGMLDRVNVAGAAALVVTMDDHAAAERVVRAARQRAPGLRIIARALDDASAAHLITLGATHAVPEVLEAGLHLGQVLLEGIGMPVDAARTVVEERRDVARRQVPGLR